MEIGPAGPASRGAHDLDDCARRIAAGAPPLNCNYAWSRQATYCTFSTYRSTVPRSKNWIKVRRMAAVSFVSHCQITSVRHPCAPSSNRTRRSRSTFRSNFACQKSSRDLGCVAFLQPSCRCQKQPCTKIATFHRGNTRSGVPGKSVRCSLNLKPSEWATRRTLSSGTVLRPFTRDINQDLLSTLRRSIISHSAAVAILLLSPSFLCIARNTASAIIGDTLLPIIRKLCHIVGWNR